MSASIVRIVRAWSAWSVEHGVPIVRRPRAIYSADDADDAPRTAPAAVLGEITPPLCARWRAGRRRFVVDASLPATIIAALLLAGCGSTPAPDPAPSSTRGTVVDMDAYGDLVDALDAGGYQGRDADHLIETVCTAPQTPQELIEAVPSMARMTRLAVTAGCPERKDWT